MVRRLLTVAPAVKCSVCDLDDDWDLIKEAGFGQARQSSVASSPAIAVCLYEPFSTEADPAMRLSHEDLMWESEAMAAVAGSGTLDGLMTVETDVGHRKAILLRTVAAMVKKGG